MTDIERRLAALESQVMRLVRVSPLARVSSTGEGDQVEAAPADGNTPAPAYTTKRFQHAGFKSTPVVNSSARAVAVFARGGSQNGAIVAEDDGHDPGLDSGEAVVYSPSAPSCRTWYDKDGSMHLETPANQPIVIHAGAGANVTIDAGTGGSVKVNGGGRQVAAQGDTAGPYPITAVGLFFERQ